MCGLYVVVYGTSISGYVNDIYYLSEIVANQKGNYKIVKATSSNSSVASVSTSTGKIILYKTGTCTFTVTNAYGTPKYTVKSSKSSIVSVRKSGNAPIIRGKRTGSAVLNFTCGSKKFSIRVKVVKGKIVLASSVALTKGNSRTLSANESTDGLYIKKVTSIKGLLSVKISSNARSLTMTANKSFSGTSASDKVVVTFNNGAKKTITVKITKPKTTKKFSLSDVKIKLNRSYWDGSKSCLKYTITNNSSKNLTKLDILVR